MYSVLAEKYKSIIEINADDVDTLKEFFVPFVAEKNSFLTHKGDVENYIYFIIEGYVRSFLKEVNTEITTRISTKSEFICCYDSFSNRTPSDEYLECITDIKGLKIAQKDMDTFYAKNPKWIKTSIKFLSDVLAERNERIRQLSIMPAKDRYEQLLNEKPDVIQYVPLRYIASYLGIKPESLSRIRSTYTS